MRRYLCLGQRWQFFLMALTLIVCVSCTAAQATDQTQLQQNLPQITATFISVTLKQPNPTPQPVLALPTPPVGTRPLALKLIPWVTSKPTVTLPITSTIWLTST